MAHAFISLLVCFCALPCVSLLILSLTKSHANGYFDTGSYSHYLKIGACNSIYYCLLISIIYIT
jgi:cell division protein FtsX